MTTGYIFGDKLPMTVETRMFDELGLKQELLDEFRPVWLDFILFSSIPVVASFQISNVSRTKTLRHMVRQNMTTIDIRPNKVTSRIAILLAVSERGYDLPSVKDSEMKKDNITEVTIISFRIITSFHSVDGWIRT
ncbi:hypothetical protein CHS0354_009333 [Potamilus streckersoni]|uniref:Uncharacterized protein n=1 Tax=Potamilus streckersoni TaxID=2493646 RepID=A0AAE0VYM0_9BIVA|nr:hypothetical protein CHS0354_009333 [Potamilus streckersoni]